MPRTMQSTLIPKDYHMSCNVIHISCTGTVRYICHDPKHEINLACCISNVIGLSRVERMKGLEHAALLLGTLGTENPTFHSRDLNDQFK